MEYVFNLTITKKHADIALRRFIRRNLGWGMLIAVVLCVSYLIYDLGRDFGKHLSPLTIAVIALLVILALVTSTVYLVQRKRIFTVLDKIGDSPVEYRLDEEELTTKSPLGSSTLKWEMLVKVWIDPDMTMIFFSQNGYFTAPTDQFPEGALDFLAEKIEAGGGIVRDKR